MLTVYEKRQFILSRTPEGYSVALILHVLKTRSFHPHGLGGLVTMATDPDDNSETSNTVKPSDIIALVNRGLRKGKDKKEKEEKRSEEEKTIPIIFPTNFTKSWIRVIKPEGEEFDPKKHLLLNNS